MIEEKIAASSKAMKSKSMMRGMAQNKSKIKSNIT